jgi:hypothetical protein
MQQQNNYVIGIQCFVKIDTLQDLLASLEKCIGKEKYTLVFFIDNTHNMSYNNRSHWYAANKHVINYIYSYKEQKKYLYKNIIIKLSNNNVGPYKGAKILIDECFQHSDYVIFTEDDAVLAKDYLLFYETLYESFIKDDQKAYGGSALSTCRNIEKNIEDWHLIQKVHWLNCTEFAVPRHIWEKFGYLRGEVVGDRKFAEAVKPNGYYSYYPIIDRFYKSGINHPDAFTIYHNHHDAEIHEVPLRTNILDINISLYQLNCK